MAQIHTSRLETQRNSSAHPDQIEGGVHETASTAIKAAALSFGADVVGIANVERWEAYAPAGYRPTDLLPGARSVVVVGARGPSASNLFSLDNLHMNLISAYALRVTTVPAENSLSTRVCQCQGSLLPYSTNNVLSHHAISDV